MPKQMFVPCHPGVWSGRDAESGDGQARRGGHLSAWRLQEVDSLLYCRCKHMSACGLLEVSEGLTWRNGFDHVTSSPSSLSRLLYMLSLQPVETASFSSPPSSWYLLPKVAPYMSLHLVNSRCVYFPRAGRLPSSHFAVWPPLSVRPTPNSAILCNLCALIFLHIIFFFLYLRSLSFNKLGSRPLASAINLRDNVFPPFILFMSGKVSLIFMIEQ